MSDEMLRKGVARNAPSLKTRIVPLRLTTKRRLDPSCALVTCTGSTSEPGSCVRVTAGRVDTAGAATAWPNLRPAPGERSSRNRAARVSADAASDGPARATDDASTRNATATLPDQQPKRIALNFIILGFYEYRTRTRSLRRTLMRQ